MGVLMKDESAPIFATALLYQFPFFSCTYVSIFLSHVLFIIVYKLSVLKLVKEGSKEDWYRQLGYPRKIKYTYLLTYIYTQNIIARIMH